MKMSRARKEDLCRKLRATIAELGRDAVKGAVIIGTYECESVSDIPYLRAPTVSNHTLGNVSFKTARVFEDA